ncbi:HNH endonuclease [Streptomyces althioticus]|uniref:HNH endonuclease n=1 Tax=Streptomyces althioticus TaxID=83380 RepID=UPI0018737875
MKTSPICRVEWCSREVKAKGLCAACYFYARAHSGDPASRRPFGPRTVGDVLAMVAAIERDANGCRDARGTFWVDRDEYPRTRSGELRGAVTRIVLADALGRPIKEGHVACHTCDHPWCVERAHLWEGTHQDNLRDRDRKGRAARGAANGSVTLTEANVREIRRDYRPWTGPHDPGNRGELARRYGVHPATINNIVARRSWAHVE